MTIGVSSLLRWGIPFVAAAAILCTLLLSQSSAGATPSVGTNFEPVVQEQTSEPTSYPLDFRWSAWGWLGITGVDIIEALEGNTSPDGDLSDRITAMYSWDTDEQVWRGFFPSAVGIPGVNDFTSFTRYQAYFIAITEGPAATFIPPGQP